MGHSLIAYDISSDGIRRTVSRLLENWGTRLQQSPVCAACLARAGIAAYAPPQAHIFL